MYNISLAPFESIPVRKSSSNPDMINMKDLRIDNEDELIPSNESVLSQIKVKNSSSIQSFNFNTHKSSDGLKFIKDKKSLDIEQQNSLFANKLKNIIENKICPLCRDFLTKYNQLEQWNEIHQIISNCYNKENPIKLLFGNDPSDIEEYSKYCLIKEFDSDDKHNLSFTNNSCSIQ